MYNSNDTTIFNLNTKLVSLMVKGDNGGAAVQLQHTTIALQGLLSDLQSQPHRTEMMDDVLYEDPQHDLLLPQHPLALVFLSTANDLPSNNEIGGVLPFFNKAVFVQGSHPMLPLTSRFQLAASVVYNTALFFHKEALRTGENRLVHKSIEFYNLAQDLLERLEGSRHDDGTIVLCLAVWNNLGHAQMLLANYRQAQQCTEQMQFVLEHAVLDDADGVQDVGDFFLTASLGTLNNHAATTATCSGFNICPAA
ncbi:expressed unknown protein [Seminavis robusta]|uniref:Uncharacterized protein n=1 Tax=Seminavis robusta TaxID=568900 RepID=A0A9N8E7Q0_9STRA|nr:expressed unknown protein [Seminavis robusta]|eukprot:Sro711_g191230.1 n/a (252) ;mRNA; f:37036-37791